MENITLEIGRNVTGQLPNAMEHEWQLTNGIGGFAAGTVAGINTRRYHGLLIASLAPPVDRTLMVSSLDISINYLGRDYALASNEFSDGTVSPQGYRYLESFKLENGLPVWRYNLADALIEKRILMRPGKNSTYLQLQVLRSSAPLQIELRPFCTYRDYHSHSHGGWELGVEVNKNDFCIRAYEGAQSYRITCMDAIAEADSNWYWNYKHRVESYRGLDDIEDLFSPGYFNASLIQSQQISIEMTCEVETPIDYTTVAIEIRKQQQTLLKSVPKGSPDWIKQLVLASDQFVVDRYDKGKAVGKTVIAGYPWFSDWGRDTMIALPGLTLSTKRFPIAASIIRTFAQHISEGMLPNRFPDNESDEPEYNTVDATLWYFNTIHEYTVQSGDLGLADELFGALEDIVNWHIKGTRYGIKMDPQDHLLHAGEAGVQLTWMDAKVGDWVVTARIGKPVEINALWYNALQCLVDLGRRLDKNVSDWLGVVEKVQNSFTRFWNYDDACLYDVIDGPEGVLGQDGKRYDASFRPNQIFAVSLPFSPLTAEQCQQVVDACAQKLLTSNGLRSLAPDDSAYVEIYAGDSVQRDGSYHQGTVWSWLLGPFAEAHYRVYASTEQALAILEPMALHLREGCLGTVSEIFDAEPPHLPRGCYAQAWGVSETLRVWLKLND